MFGISFSELIVVFIIAFLVLGPEKLQDFAKSLGKFISSINNFSSNLKEEISSSISTIKLDDTNSTNEFKDTTNQDTKQDAKEDTCSNETTDNNTKSNNISDNTTSSDKEISSNDKDNDFKNYF